MGFRTAVDLRTTLEVEERGTGAPLPRCRYLHLPLFETVRPGWIAPLDQSPVATAARYLEMLSDGTEALVTIVRELAEAETCPLVVHCAAGRDRTGIVVACLLDLVGVPDDAIAADYALSDGFVDDGARAHAETMRAFLSLLREEHGSTRALLDAHGVSASTLRRVIEGLVV